MNRIFPWLFTKSLLITCRIAKNVFPAPAEPDTWMSSCQYLESSLSFSAWWFVSCEEVKRLAEYWSKNDVLSTASSSVIPHFSKAPFSRDAKSSLSTASLSRCFSWICCRSKSTAKEGMPFWSRDSMYRLYMEFCCILHDLLQRVLSQYVQVQELLKKVRGVPQTLGLELFPCFLARHLPFHIMMVMVVLGVLRNRRLEKLSCDKTILIWVKCVDNVTRFELSSQEFRHINFVIIPSAICAPHLIQLGDFTLLGATAPFPIPKFGRWKHCPEDFALAYFTREEHHFKFLSQVYCCLDSVKPLLKPSAAPAGSSLVLLPQFFSVFSIFIRCLSKHDMTIHCFCSFFRSAFSSSVHMCFTSWRYPRAL